MAKVGRPGISYEQFVEVWKQLQLEGRATTNAAQDILGGNKSTLAAHREKYEHEQASKELALMRGIELPEALHKAIATIKVKEIELLEKTITELKARNDSYIDALKKADEERAAATVHLNDAKMNFDLERTQFERRCAAAEARVEDLLSREKKLQAQVEQLTKDYNQAKQEAAVAKKEIELLRENKKA